MFGFGDFDLNNELLLTRKDISILNKAPVSNMDDERHVGRVNYELSIRGAKELPAASSSVVKSQSFDLIELRAPDAFQDFRKISGHINKLVGSWR